MLANVASLLSSSVAFSFATPPVCGSVSRAYTAAGVGFAEVQRGDLGIVVSVDADDQRVSPGPQSVCRDDADGAGGGGCVGGEGGRKRQTVGTHGRRRAKAPAA